MAAFEGFNNADFNAFEKPKWSSNAYNLERLELKLKLTSLGKTLIQRLPQVLVDKEMGLSEERPSIFNQHQVRNITLFFHRDAQSRSEIGTILDKAKSIADNIQDPAVHHRHITLAIRIGFDGLEYGLWLHRNAWIDWKNAIQRCSKYGEEDRFGNILKALPHEVGYTVGDGLSHQSQPACQADYKEVLAGFETMTNWSVFGVYRAKEDPSLAGQEVIEQIEHVFTSLVPLYGFIAWSRDNDHHELKEALREQKEKVQKQFKQLGVGDRVRIVRGLASGRVGVIDSIEKKGVVKVRIGMLVMTSKMEELVEAPEKKR